MATQRKHHSKQRAALAWGPGMQALQSPAVSPWASLLAPGSKLSPCLNTPPIGACFVGFGGGPELSL